MNIVNVMTPYQLTMLQCERNILVILPPLFPLDNSDRKINYGLNSKTHKTKCKTTALQP